MKLKLVYYPSPFLTAKSEPVTEFNEELHSQLDQMKEILLSTKGIGLSANQCGLLKRIFIMKDKHDVIWEFINPELSEPDGVANIMEGCLSSPNVYSKVYTRSNSVLVKAYNRNGVEFIVIPEGIESVCCQHEIDHLDGIFWFERLPNRQAKKSAEKNWDKQRKKLGV